MPIEDICCCYCGTKLGATLQDVTNKTPIKCPKCGKETLLRSAEESPRLSEGASEAYLRSLKTQGKSQPDFFYLNLGSEDSKNPQ